MNTAGPSIRASVTPFGVFLALVLVSGGCAYDNPGVADPSPPPTSASSSTVSSSVVSPAPSPPSSNVEPAPPSSQAASTLPPPEPSREWTLLAGGDVLMDRTEPLGVDPFEFIRPSLASAELAVVNAEMAISGGGAAADKQYVFRAPPSTAHRIAAAGVDVANLANNHAKDYGSSGLVDTIELLEQQGVVALGAGATDIDAYRYRVLDTGVDVSVAFVGVSMIVPRNFPAGPDTPGIASARPPSRVMESVRAAKDTADVVIAVVHWGVERTTCPNAAQRDFAQELLGAGADAVIGHHPHVLQPIEFANGKLVAYSLGNFIWHPRAGITGETGVLQIDFDAEEIVGWDFHPHLLNNDGAPVPTTDGTRYERIKDIIAGNCATHQPPPLEPSTTSSTIEAPTTTTTPTSAAALPETTG